MDEVDRHTLSNVAKRAKRICRLLENNKGILNKNDRTDKEILDGKYSFRDYTNPSTDVQKDSVINIPEKFIVLKHLLQSIYSSREIRCGIENDKLIPNREQNRDALIFKYMEIQNECENLLKLNTSP